LLTIYRGKHPLINDGSGQFFKNIIGEPLRTSRKIYDRNFAAFGKIPSNILGGGLNRVIQTYLLLRSGNTSH
jgi:hypothetical protein